MASFFLGFTRREVQVLRRVLAEHRPGATTQVTFDGIAAAPAPHIKRPDTRPADLICSAAKNAPLSPPSQ